MFTMQVGNILNANFDAIYNIYNPTVYSVADVIDTLVMRTGFENGYYERGTAIGLVQVGDQFCLAVVGKCRREKDQRLRHVRGG